MPACGLADDSTSLMGAYLVLTGLMARDRNDGLGWVIDLALYKPLFTLMGPQLWITIN